jgi:hypothetical protein
VQGRHRERLLGLRLAGAAAVIGAAGLALPASGWAASVQNIDPPSGAAMTEGAVTLRWDLDVSDCDPGKTAVTQVQVEIDGRLGPDYLPEPPGSGLNAGLFAAAAGDGFRFTINAVNVRTDGAPSVYRWRAYLDCTGPGIPPDPTAVPIHVVGPWSEFRITRVSQGPGTTQPPPGGAQPPAAVARVPKERVGGGSRRITRFLGWAPRNRPLPTPFRAGQVPRPLTPAGGTIRSCARGPRGVLLVFRYTGFSRPRPIRWTWRLDGAPIGGGQGTIGVPGHTLYSVWAGFRDRPIPNGVYSVSLTIGGRFFGSAAVRRAC